MRTVFAILGVLMMLAGLYVGYLITFVYTSWSLLFCGFWLLILLGGLLIAQSMKETPEERAISAQEEFDHWSNQAVKKGYSHRSTASLTLSPYTRPRVVHHYAVGKRGATFMGDEKDTVEDTLVSTWGKSFFLTESDNFWQDDIQIIKFENLMIVRNSLNNEFKVFASRDI